MISVQLALTGTPPAPPQGFEVRRMPAKTFPLSGLSTSNPRRASEQYILLRDLHTEPN